MSQKPFDVILAELAKPFDPEVVEFKPGAVAKTGDRALALAYVDSRAYQARLDEVDPTWSNTYAREYPEGRVVVTCALTIAGVTRQAIGECLLSNVHLDGSTTVEENAATSAEAQAFKRACAAFGLGRYLYAVPQTWADYDSTKRQFTPAAVQMLRALLRNGNGHNGNGNHNNGNGSADEQVTADVSEPAVAAPAATPAATPAPAPTPVPGNGNGSGVKVVGPACPKCGGPMWDNRASKKNPRAPDFKCKNKNCDGVIWPSKSTGEVGF